jgi:pimeloyl-ACP methyl ester carboxylesterase
MFPNVSMTRWMEEVNKFFMQKPDGLELSYDPKLRDAVEATSHAAVPDLWPWYEALSDLPLAILRGANSDLLTQACYEDMLKRIPTAMGAVIADRAHVPFLDEPEAVALLQAWIAKMQ